MSDIVPKPIRHASCIPRRRRLSRILHRSDLVLYSVTTCVTSYHLFQNQQLKPWLHAAEVLATVQLSSPILASYSLAS